MSGSAETKLNSRPMANTTIAATPSTWCVPTTPSISAIGAASAAPPTVQRRLPMRSAMAELVPVPMNSPTPMNTVTVPISAVDIPNRVDSQSPYTANTMIWANGCIPAYT